MPLSSTSTAASVSLSPALGDAIHSLYNSPLGLTSLTPEKRGKRGKHAATPACGRTKRKFEFINCAYSHPNHGIEAYARVAAPHGPLAQSPDRSPANTIKITVVIESWAYDQRQLSFAQWPQAEGESQMYP